jgi:hypothetical protein
MQMNGRRWLVIASLFAASMLANCLPAAADPPYANPPYIMAQPCGGLLNALLGCQRPYPYYYGGPLSGATHDHYYANHWPRPYWRHARYHHVVH